MKILLFQTGSHGCGIFSLSLLCIGHEVDVVRYDDCPHDRHHEFVEYAKKSVPDVIVYIGAIEDSNHSTITLFSDVLKKLRDISKVIHICCDASHYPWWPLLKKYDVEECFDAQVSIDGNFETPLAGFRNGIVKLAPTDPTLFDPQTWKDRPIFSVFAGYGGNCVERIQLISHLTTTIDMHWIYNMAYRDMCISMGKSKISVNHSMVGDGKFHVKARVVESGFAGACLLERKNPHTAKWFLPGIDYIEYVDAHDASAKIKWAKNNESEIEGMAEKFHTLILQKHHPRIFWRDVFERAGVKCAL